MACVNALVNLIHVLLICIPAFGSIQDLEPNSSQKNDSQCYGTVAPNTIYMQCDPNYTLVPKSLTVGTKKNSTCLSVVRNSTVSRNITYHNICCTHNESENCVLNHQDEDYTKLWKYIGLKASGYQNAFTEVAQIPHLICTDGYLENSTYNTVEYYCIPDSRTFLINHTFDIKNTKGETLYLQSPGYPRNTTSTGGNNHSCLVITNCTNTVTVYGLDYALSHRMRLHFKDLVSNRTLLVENDSNKYKITEIFSSDFSKLVISFHGDGGRSNGRFRVAFTVSGQSDLRLLCPYSVENFEECDTMTTSISGGMTTTSGNTHSSSNSASEGSAKPPYVNIRSTTDIQVNHTQSVTNNSQFYKSDKQQAKSDMMTYILASLSAVLVIAVIAITVYMCSPKKKKVKPNDQLPYDEEEVVHAKSSPPDDEYPTTLWNNPPGSLPPLEQAYHLEKDKRPQKGHQKKRKKKKKDNSEEELDETQTESVDKLSGNKTDVKVVRGKSSPPDDEFPTTFWNNPPRSPSSLEQTYHLEQEKRHKNGHKKNKKKKKRKKNETQTESVDNILKSNITVREKEENPSGSKTGEDVVREKSSPPHDEFLTTSRNNPPRSPSPLEQTYHLEQEKRPQKGQKKKKKKRKKKDDPEGEMNETQTESVDNVLKLNITVREKEENPSGSKTDELEIREDDDAENPRRKHKKKKKNKENFSEIQNHLNVTS
ncbi:uncharacterized protein LOC125677051 isoform X6 [Ostrea edulis]|uniref:uncharacterized protein LOC125677051 isoform X6 n=1 Tax=Ostrea edulis TaxID=37623 RepID=UPI0024AE9703|nr:uncharacterized protein LOC125677051 isoform X6 [Ostrea edulis]